MKAENVKKNIVEIGKSVTLIIAVLMLMASVASAATVGLSKETSPPDLTVKAGDTVTYQLEVCNPSDEFSMTLDRIWDEYPDGTEATLATDVVLAPGECWAGNTDYDVKGTEPLTNGKIVNTLKCIGQNELGDDVNGMVTKSNRLIVPEKPVAKFVYNLPCESRTVSFDASSSYDPDGTIMSYDWDFGDGNAGSGVAVSHTYAADGTYSVTLTVCDNDGECDTETKNVVVSWRPCDVCKLRLYGTFDKGAGDLNVIDPDTGLQPENKPYTDPNGPFFPQHAQSPRKDFITFNPAIMDHNQGYPELSYTTCGDDLDVQREGEKVFKRMWYEKEWFKDHDGDGCWDVVIEDAAGDYVTTVEICNMDDWNEIIHPHLAMGHSVRVANNDPSIGDIYGPAVVQEFTYMAVEVLTDDPYDPDKPFANMPIMVRTGSKVLIPMASWNPGDGIDSFDADGDGVRDAVKVESENTLGMDIDQDGILEVIDGDGIPLSGDETVVFVLKKWLEEGDTIQFFDHKVLLKDVFQLGNEGSAIFTVMDNEGGGSQRYTDDVTLGLGDSKLFYRGEEANAGTNFYVKLVAADAGDNKAIVEVGRMFGQPYANIGANVDWNQKAFMVDGVFYNIVAIKGIDDCFKYITIREKLPKVPIKLYGKHLEVWGPNMILPELPPFNAPHEIIVDVQSSWTVPQSYEDKIGKKIDRPALEIFYVEESVEERYKGELKEIYAEGYIQTPGGDLVRGSAPGDMYKEFWLIEWFYTYPDQYTEFVLPKDELYLVTLSWIAPEAMYHIWDGEDEDGPIAHGFVNRVKFWYGDCTGPIYITDHGIRVFGTFGEGAGDFDVRDPYTGLQPENKPYTDPMGPFFPQHPQAPDKDFITFNPAIMDHNQGYPELSFTQCNGLDVQREQEKVFKRLWYEKDWFKDHDGDGCWDLVIEDSSGNYVDTFEMCEWTEFKELHDYLADGYSIRVANNDPNIGDIYGPAVVQEFTYMTLDDVRMPIMVRTGSKVLIPMASWNPGDGIDSFDADGDGVRDAVKVESENTLGMDIDQDGILEVIDGDGIPLSGDETVVFVLKKWLEEGDTIQFFDHKVLLKDVFQLGNEGSAIFTVMDNEGGGSQRYTDDVTLGLGDSKLFYRGEEANAGTNFYVKLVAADAGDNKAIVEVGRMFGQPYANIGANVDWNQKAFMVDGVFYNIVAIKGIDDCFKYITIREKLPKVPIKLYGKHLEVWDIGEILPELPPFNAPHEIIVDVQSSWTVPESMEDKIGPKIPRPAMAITYTEEDVEERFKGELKEIYFETGEGVCSCEPGQTVCLPCDEEHKEMWISEWFYTYPDQYTVFDLPVGELYLMTLSWYAPEASYHIWDGGYGNEMPLAHGTGNRVKFWYDPADPTDIYVNYVNPPTPEPCEMYDTNGNGTIEKSEAVQAVNDYFADLIDKETVVKVVQCYFAGP
jgi:PKD repeat protein